MSIGTVIIQISLFILAVWSGPRLYAYRITGYFNAYYGKCPKISYTKVSDKMAYANSADPDQTAPEGAVWWGSTLFAIPLFLETTA